MSDGSVAEIAFAASVRYGVLVCASWPGCVLDRGVAGLGLGAAVWLGVLFRDTV